MGGLITEVDRGSDWRNDLGYKWTLAAKELQRLIQSFQRKETRLIFFFLTIKPIRYHSAGHTIGSQ